MDETLNFINEKKIERVIASLEKNNMQGYYIKSREELFDKINELVSQDSLVAVGGSMTLFETGVIDFLRKGKYNFLDRYADGLNAEDIKEIYRKSFYADAYFTSTNAITEEGQLYNVDGTGNRVAAMMWGPDKVIVICGVNKIVKDIHEAEERNKNISAPANTKRLKKRTPCEKTGHCMDCKSEERICCKYTVIARQTVKNRIYVLFLNENLGY